MLLSLTRMWTVGTTVTSILLVDEQYQCFILEPNPPDVPCGTFEVTIRWSDKHQRDLPHIENVPGHQGIEIHPGNFRRDTLGCWLPGLERSVDPQGNGDVLESVAAFNALFAKMKQAILGGDKIRAEVKEGYGEGET